jgi:hypothetical protein
MNVSRIRRAAGARVARRFGLGWDGDSLVEEQEGGSNADGEGGRGAETSANGEGGPSTEVERRSKSVYGQPRFPSLTKLGDNHLSPPCVSTM